MGKIIRIILSLTIFLNCVAYAQKGEGSKSETEIPEETDILLLAERYCAKKNISQERLVSYIHSFIPAVNTWSEIKKINPRNWPEVEKKVDSLLAKEGMRLFTVFATWFIGWNLAYFLWRFGTK
ncbi:MAG: hypothetical protein ABIK81_02125 [candidate division WOR-3 bacterium]